MAGRSRFGTNRKHKLINEDEEGESSGHHGGGVSLLGHSDNEDQGRHEPDMAGSDAFEASLLGEAISMANQADDLDPAMIPRPKKARFGMFKNARPDQPEDKGKNVVRSPAPVAQPVQQPTPEPETDMEPKPVTTASVSQFDAATTQAPAAAQPILQSQPGMQYFNGHYPHAYLMSPQFVQQQQPGVSSPAVMQTTQAGYPIPAAPNDPYPGQLAMMVHDDDDKHSLDTQHDGADTPPQAGAVLANMMDVGQPVGPHVASTMGIAPRTPPDQPMAPVPDHYFARNDRDHTDDDQTGGFRPNTLAQDGQPRTAIPAGYAPVGDPRLGQYEYTGYPVPYRYMSSAVEGPNSPQGSGTLSFLSSSFLRDVEMLTNIWSVVTAAPAAHVMSPRPAPAIPNMAYHHQTTAGFMSPPQPAPAVPAGFSYHHHQQSGVMSPPQPASTVPAGYPYPQGPGIMSPPQPASTFPAGYPYPQAPTVQHSSQQYMQSPPTGYMMPQMSGTPFYAPAPQPYRGYYYPPSQNEQQASQGIDSAMNQANRTNTASVPTTSSSTTTTSGVQSPPARQNIGGLASPPSLAQYNASTRNDSPAADMSGSPRRTLGSPFRPIRDTVTNPPGQGGLTPSGSANSIRNSQFNQTEPRNFAPRTDRDHLVQSPPFFPLARADSPSPVGGNSPAMSPDALAGQLADLDPFGTAEMNHYTTRALRIRSPPAMGAAQVEFPAWVPGPVPEATRKQRSEELNRLTAGPTGLPDIETALHPDIFPFIESCHQAQVPTYGVIKLKNIPFATRRAEIIAFLGRNSKILNDNQEPVHIIMERVTSKTQDAYVEFMTVQDAMRAVERHGASVTKGRTTRLGERPVDVELSSQSALMRDLFPLAHGVFWDGARPEIQPPVAGQPWRTFRGFVSEEEVTMLVKHVEIPQRSPFSRDCPQRPYECMISTLKKLPWHMSGYITVQQRHAVYDACMKLIKLLSATVARQARGGGGSGGGSGEGAGTLTAQLLKRLVTAAMLCPGFSVVQKDNVAVEAGMREEQTREFNQPRFADYWTHQLALCPRPGVPVDVLEWYVALVREQTTRAVHGMAIAERTPVEDAGKRLSNLYWGYMFHEVGFPRGRGYDRMTLAQAARMELDAIERVLRAALRAA